MLGSAAATAIGSIKVRTFTHLQLYVIFGSVTGSSREGLGVHTGGIKDRDGDREQMAYMILCGNFHITDYWDNGYIYRPQTKFREGTVSTSVCQEFCPDVSVDCRVDASVEGGVSQHAMDRGCASPLGWPLKRVVRILLECNRQGSHQSGKSGNSGKILKTFSSQGNQGKTGVFQPKSGKKISNQGTFFSNHF